MNNSCRVAVREFRNWDIDDCYVIILPDINNFGNRQEVWFCSVIWTVLWSEAYFPLEHFVLKWKNSHLMTLLDVKLHTQRIHTGHVLHVFTSLKIQGETAAGKGSSTSNGNTDIHPTGKSVFRGIFRQIGRLHWARNKTGTVANSVLLRQQGRDYSAQIWPMAQHTCCFLLYHDETEWNQPSCQLGTTQAVGSACSWLPAALQGSGPPGMCPVS